jgi:hypothetical protein
MSNVKILERGTIYCGNIREKLSLTTKRTIYESSVRSHLGRA